jgi:hypothetical protein
VSLPTWLDLKRRVKAQTTITDAAYAQDSAYGNPSGDGTLFDCVRSATAAVRAYVQRPLIAERMTFIDRMVSLRAYQGLSRLLVPIWPVSSAEVDAPVVTDFSAVVVDPTTYQIDYDKGEFIGVPSGAFSAPVTFDNPPYTIAATVGLSARADYVDVVEPILWQAILDAGADFFIRRDSAAIRETAGGGVSREYDKASGLPIRVCRMLAPYRQIGWA